MGTLPARLGPWRWNAGTFAHLGGEGSVVLFESAKKDQKGRFASLAGWAKDGTVALVSTSKLGEFSRAIEIPAQ